MRIGRLRLALMLLAAFAPDAGAEAWCNTPTVIGHGAMEVEGVEDDWYKVYTVAPAVFAISEPRQAEGVNSFLIVGSQRAVLFDSGLGVGHISRIVRRLTTLPVTVVN